MKSSDIFFEGHKRFADDVATDAHAFVLCGQFHKPPRDLQLAAAFAGEFGIVR
jgi:hypothetical protein